MKLNLFVFGSAKLIALFSEAALSHEICVCVYVEGSPRGSLIITLCVCFHLDYA